ncbi:hypothetical protein SKAU_G00235870 [Synaphobranchus kaupii]|uniref:BEN domain-containing protein n=1 Tax=Synaphobranchus kaupii TaxID=118154 RepID=A0A9Q1F6L2_SYNKA|nr:hypothetical protein SKAU_G00235870 [Synaphobranchus kaupii]
MTVVPGSQYVSHQSLPSNLGSFHLCSNSAEIRFQTSLSARKDSSVPIPAEGQGTTDGFISKELLCLCAKHNAQTFINDLLHGLYTREYMAEHSLTGAKSSVGKDQPKQPIPWKELELITKAAKEHFPSLTDGNIRALIRQKLNNASQIKN